MADKLNIEDYEICKVDFEKLTNAELRRYLDVIGVEVETNERNELLEKVNKHFSNYKVNDEKVIDFLEGLETNDQIAQRLKK